MGGTDCEFDSRRPDHMTLTTHAIVGAAMASLVPQAPVLGFALGFASHFAIDAIPHWAEGTVLLHSVEKETKDPLSRYIRGGRELLHDIAVVLTDSVIGFALALLILFYLFHVSLYIVLLGALAGQTPDGLQFIYMKLRPKLMDGLQRFHESIQEEHTNPVYLLREVGLIAAVIILGILGAFVL